MLALSFEEGESVYLILPNGDTIQVKYSYKKRGSTIALGFVAPQNVKILRERIYNEEYKDVNTRTANGS